MADLTYSRRISGCRGEFCYLATLLDAYSRRVVGWGLARTLEAEVALAASTALRHGGSVGRAGSTTPTAGCNMRAVTTCGACGTLERRSA